MATPNLFLVLLFSFNFLFLITLGQNATQNKPSPFEFLRSLQSAQKGQKVEGIHQLKEYLSRFGYLHSQHVGISTEPEADVFHPPLEDAVKRYQQFYGLKQTGKLDAPTLSRMMEPRCGRPDIEGGGYRKHHGSYNTVIHFTYFPGMPRWTKTSLTYSFFPGFPSQWVEPVESALRVWSIATKHYFTFVRTQASWDSDIKIIFGRLSNERDVPFDGPDGVLAWSFSAPDGRFHLDADERWSNGPVPGTYDIESVAIHELGHVLGLNHSQYESAIMWSTFNPGVTKSITIDDIQGVRSLYRI